jgi:hypothetical protein
MGDLDGTCKLTHVRVPDLLRRITFTTLSHNRPASHNCSSGTAGLFKSLRHCRVELPNLAMSPIMDTDNVQEVLEPHKGRGSYNAFRITACRREDRCIDSSQLHTCMWCHVCMMIDLFNTRSSSLLLDQLSPLLAFCIYIIELYCTCIKPL